MAKKTIYHLIDLNRRIKFGPYSEQEIWAMSDRGELQQYDLIEASRYSPSYLKKVDDPARLSMFFWKSIFSAVCASVQFYKPLRLPWQIQQ